jgi:hypothetical protein
MTVCAVLTSSSALLYAFETNANLHDHVAEVAVTLLCKVVQILAAHIPVIE